MPSEENTARTTGQPRLRSVPHPRSFFVAIFWCVLFYFSVITAIAGIALFTLDNGKHSLPLTIPVVLLLAVILLWFISFLSCRRVSCPLCKGTPYATSGAHAHKKARKIFPFSYATSNVISSIFIQRFRCQYCGSPYDLLKKRSSH